jgi:hypothetical protein
MSGSNTFPDFDLDPRDIRGQQVFSSGAADPGPLVLTELPSDAYLERGGPGWFIRCPLTFGRQYCGSGATPAEARANALRSLNEYLARGGKLLQ